MFKMEFARKQVQSIIRSVILWSEFLSTDPEVPGSIPGAIRFSEKQWDWNGGPLSLVRIIEELFQGNSGSGLENRD
jgi:hypothetical protein